VSASFIPISFSKGQVLRERESDFIPQGLSREEFLLKRELELILRFGESRLQRFHVDQHGNNFC